MKTRHRAHPALPSKALHPRPNTGNKRLPTGPRMGVQGNDPNLYTNSGKTYTPADIAEMQAAVVEATRRNATDKAQEPVQSPAPVPSMSGFAATATGAVELQNLPEKEMRQKLLKLARQKFGNEPWCRGVGIATGNRVRLNIAGNYKGDDIPDAFMGVGIEKVYVDKFRPEAHRQKTRNGFTLVELLIVVCVLSIVGMTLVGIAVGFSGCGTDTIRDNAQGYARNYARQFYGMSNPVVQCAGIDTDANGYVTCTVGGNGQPPRQIECRANHLVEYDTACREQRVFNMQTNQPQ